MIKDTDEQPDVEKPGVSSGRIQGTTACVSVALGCPLSQHGCVHPHGSSWNSTLMGFYGGFLMQAQSIINSTSSPLPFLEGGEVGLKIPSFNHCLVLLVTNPGAYVESSH